MTGSKTARLRLSERPDPLGFKAIALFTPGGDLVYCIDRQKQSRWHLDLCAVLQEQLALSEPPYFLLPAYTATLDRSIDPISGQIATLAEAYPRVLRFKALLNVLFGVESAPWKPVYNAANSCSQALIETYRPQFPQLWQNHNLVIQASRDGAEPEPEIPALEPTLDSPQEPLLFRLFVRGVETPQTEELLEVLCATFEGVLKQPYTLKVIDVAQHPEQAEADQIAVTPTLIRAWPTPVRRISGDLMSLQRLLIFLQTV